MHDLPAQVSLPVLEWMVVDQFFRGVEEIRRSDDVVIADGRFRGFQISVPIDRWSHRLYLREAHLVIDVLRIAPLDVVHLRRGHCGFEFDYRACIRRRLRFRFPGEHEHLLDVRAIFGEDLLRLVVRTEIIVAIGQAQAALIDLSDDHGGVVVILSARKAEQWRTALVVSTEPSAGIQVMKVRDFKREILLALERCDAVEFCLQRLETCGFDAALVHACRPVVANLLLDRAAIASALAGRLHGVAKHAFVPDFEAASGAPIDLVGRNRISSQPLAAREFVEVVTGIERLVDHVGIEAL